jgi:branched-chain amino acid transport system substrate-binding protein
VPFPDTNEPVLSRTAKSGGFMITFLFHPRAESKPFVARTPRALVMLVAVGAFGALLSLSASARVDGDTIILGSSISLTGKFFRMGVRAKRGYDLAVERINQSGGVKIGNKSYKLSVVYYDDESMPARAKQHVKHLIEQDGVKFFLGPYSSGLTKIVAAVTEEHKLPMIASQAASRALFNQSYKYLFTVLSTSDQYFASTIALAAEVVTKYGKRASDMNIAMAFENDPASLSSRAGVIDHAGKYAMKIVIDDRLPPDLGDMSATLEKVRTMKPDLLLVSGHSMGATTAARQIDNMNIDVPMIAITHCESAELIHQFAYAANGFLCPTQWSETLSYHDDLFGSTAEYAKLFKARYPSYATVPNQSAQASAAVMVWKRAFERAGSFDTDVLRDAIAKTSMNTFFGGIAFSEDGNNTAKPMVVRQIQNGEFNTVAPSRLAPHPVQWPRKAR